jgi:hypothetical protein
VSSKSWWKSDRWQLSAPSSYVLKHGAGASGVEAFKLALMDLTARGALKIVKQEELSGLRRRKLEVTYLAPGLKPTRPGEPSLASVFDVHTHAPQRALESGAMGVRVTEFVTRARVEYGAISQYVPKVVVPELVGRGLFTAIPRSFLGIIKWRTYELTPAGQQARAELEAWAATGEKELSELVQHDPARAVAFAALAGSSVLLTASLYPELQRLRERIRDEGYEDAGGYYTASYVGNSDDETGGGFELPQIDFGSLDFGLDLSALDSLSDISSDIDSGVSDAGGDGGGGDGGGDGGGGGGD